MKFVSNKIETYVSNVTRTNLHPYLETTFKNIYELTNKSFHSQSSDNDDNIYPPNLLLFGPKNIGKYSQALYLLQNYSPSQLKYERKITLSFNSKTSHVFKISDVHIEIDMELLGCNAKSIFNELFKHIVEIFSTKPNRCGFIVCKNFHKIHTELLDVFYSYMQNTDHINVKLCYILLTNSVSFLPKNIIKKCETLHLKQPAKSTYEKALKENIRYQNKIVKQLQHMNAITDKNNIENVNKVKKEKIMALKLKENIENHLTTKFSENRDILYDILIYDVDINKVILYLTDEFIKEEKLNQTNLFTYLFNMHSFLKYYNNNYRPIYHLERFLYNLCNIINDP